MTASTSSAKGAGSRVFIAGASGAIGRRLGPMLLAAGHHVTGTTRSPARAQSMRDLGIEPVVVDVFDAMGLQRALLDARPMIVMHQLTDLPRDPDVGLPPEAVLANARIRDEGTRNLVAAATTAGAVRLIAQSIAWAYRPGHSPSVEDDPLDLAAEGSRAVTMRGVASLESQVLDTRSPMLGIVLRYGFLYGPGTGRAVPGGQMPLHVDAAAHAALLATDHGDRGVFNVAEPCPDVDSGKACRDLGWDAGFRLPLTLAAGRGTP